ncbi:hypothetical protein FEM48_Zijuj09G0218300 [Ziziphus jujuba var. spinosa]|uniref:Uncharacterized protein n=1 Tax=Ziziphus jujuba var. spinosa TaxID=714518 RepID=A0A978UVI3_ZIZJJ|nr:hypothetical protein FEM48_Zijuj09G0218300 [Ziziphus jujuba var. spinosa]
MGGGNNIPLWVSNLRSLTSLYLRSIANGGSIPDGIQNLTSPVHLGLSDNSFNTSIPRWLYSLSHLEVLNLDFNRLRGSIPEDIQNLNSLVHLDLSRNSFNTSMPSWLYSLSHLGVLNLAGNQLTDVLPAWIFNFSSELEYLYLSQNQMHGRIPNLMTMGTQEYLAIDLSQNHTGGPMPLTSSKVYQLDLSDNQLSGSISQFLCSSPSEPMNMAALYLAKNQLSRNLPNCWSKWKNIKVLYLNYNSFGGGIPSSFGSLIFLQSLHLRSNNLSEILSLSSLHNCINLITLDLSRNKFGGNVPNWLGTNPSKLRGGITSYVEATLLLIKGKPIEYNKTLGLVNIMDLSGNSLSGYVPLEITNLSNLSNLLSLNLSNNLLDGEIPVKIGTQLQSFNSSSYISNNLCGPPLTLNCGTNGGVAIVEKNRKEDDHEMSWFYIVMAVGFIVGQYAFQMEGVPWPNIEETEHLQ